MAGVFTEKNLQDGVFLAFLTGHAAPALGWNKGRSEDISQMRDSQGAERDWHCRKDLMQFLQSSSNAVAFRDARRQFADDEAFLDAFIAQALLPRIMSSSDAIPALRESLSFAGQTFCLWAPAPRAGDPKGSDQAFNENILRVVDELPFKRQFPGSLPVSRRPDLTFFVNGLYFSYAELKNGFTGQSASGSGRKKIAHDLVEAATRALESAIAGYSAQGGQWPGWKARNLPESVRNEARSSICLYEKPVHILAADASKIFILSGTEWILEEVDAALHSSDRLHHLNERIPAKIIDAFSELPEIPGMLPSDAVFAHLASYFHPIQGVDKEIFFFNQNRKSRTTTATEILRPRAAQRIMLYLPRLRVEELYRNETQSKVSDIAIRTRLALELPDISPETADEIVRKSLLHLNGKESHSILLQGSTGLGKTNLIVWLAQDLADMRNPAQSAHGSEALFDTVICLTDRTELRRNLGEEADRLKATRGATIEAKSYEDLRSALMGSAKIVVVNIQKFPSLMREAEADPKFAKILSAKRVAFIIDEAHRSQNGEYHETTMELFSEFKHFEGGSKRNLVICLTATPTDATLARFGEWRSPESAGDEIRWRPFYSYSLRQAIKDKVVLNPLMNVQKFGDHIQVRADETVQSVGPGEKVREPSSEEIYENDARRKLVAAQVAKIFAVKTMMAIRPPNQPIGSGKAMFVANSINGAIAYQQHIKNALVKLSKDPKFADRAEALANCPVLILYSDKQGAPACASLNNGLSESDVQDEFRRKNEHAKKDGLKIHNAIIIVVDKLLTGFDEPTLHTIFIDRGMDGVLLYQTASRVNRTAKWKNDCLIVDFSHDGIVSKNLPAVFKLYGGMTVSEFDAMPIMERMAEAYRQFFGAKEMSTLWKSWQAEVKTDKELAATNLNNALDKLLRSDPEAAVMLRKTGGIWRSAKDKLTGILDFSLPDIKKHADEEHRAFADMVVRKLRLAEMDKAQAKGMIFDVDMVDVAEGWSVEDISPEMEEDDGSSVSSGQKLPTKKNSLPEEVAQDIIDQIEEYQQREDLKKELMEKLKAFIGELFTLVDQATQSDNNGYHKKRVLKMIAGEEDYPWDERQKKFRELLNKAVLQPKFVKSPEFIRDKKLFLEPVLRKSDMLMSDYEEWVASGSTSVFFSQPAPTPSPQPHGVVVAGYTKNSQPPLQKIDELILGSRDENGNPITG